RLTRAREPLVVEPSRLAHHERRRVEARERVGERELQALVHADRTAEDDALLAVGDRAPERRAPDAQRLHGDEDPLGVQAVEDVLEALPLLPHAVLFGYVQVVDEELAGV